MLHLIYIANHGRQYDIGFNRKKSSWKKLIKRKLSLFIMIKLLRTLLSNGWMKYGTVVVKKMYK